MWKKMIALLIVSTSFPRSESALNFNDFNNFDMVNFNLVYGYVHKKINVPSCETLKKNLIRRMYRETHMNFSRYYIRDYLKILSDENFSFDRKTLLYVHGWIEDFYSESSETIVKAYIERGDHNIIVIDWGQYSFGEYFSVIPRFTQISKMLAKLLVDMFERGLDINQLHCVGHSFGTHIMGIMGREVTRSSQGKYKIKRISALDPAHFGFWPPILDAPLSSSDAEFVDAIHTDVNFIGTTNRVGHVDFFPNNGQLQPGCPPFRFSSFMDIVNSFCSHQHSWRYWSETVKPGQEKIFPAVSCKNYRDFKGGICNQNRINFMGPEASPSVPGAFYLELQSNRNYTVDDSYYRYLASSLNYRSDLVRIVARLQQLFKALTEKKNRN